MAVFAVFPVYRMDLIQQNNILIVNITQNTRNLITNLVLNNIKNVEFAASPASLQPLLCASL